MPHRAYVENEGRDLPEKPLMEIRDSYNCLRNRRRCAAARVRVLLSACSRLQKMSAQGHAWSRQVKKEDEEEDPLDQLISRSGCAASHYAVQECMAQHQDWRQCQPQVQAFRDCMSEQQARRREELQRLKEQSSAHR
ncbi:hypothetical protein CapIbe_013151 [Capra ibex]